MWLEGFFFLLPQTRKPRTFHFWGIGHNWGTAALVGVLLVYSGQYQATGSWMVMIQQESHYGSNCWKCQRWLWQKGVRTKTTSPSEEAKTGLCSNKGRWSRGTLQCWFSLQNPQILTQSTICEECWTAKSNRWRPHHQSYRTWRFSRCFGPDLTSMGDTVQDWWSWCFVYVSVFKPSYVALYKVG